MKTKQMYDFLLQLEKTLDGNYYDILPLKKILGSQIKKYKLQCEKDMYIEELNKTNKGKAAMEKKKYKTVQELFKVNTANNKEQLNCYKPLKDNRCCITNKFVCYVGEMIEGIPECPDVALFPQVDKIIKSFRVGTVCNFNPVSLQVDYSLAKARASKETKKRGIYTSDLDAALVVKNKDGKYVSFNTELIMQCVALIGGETYSIEVNGVNDVGIVRCKENNNYCVVCPFVYKYKLEEGQKELEERYKKCNGVD